MALAEQAAQDATNARQEQGAGPRFELTVQVYAYPRDGRWYAEVTDLALMAEGATEDEALRCLIEQVGSYLSTVVHHGWLDRLHRPASRRHRLEVRARVQLARLRRQGALKRSELIRI